MNKRYVLSVLVGLALTLGFSTGQAKAKKDLAQGKTVKEKVMKKQIKDKKKH